MCKLRNSRESVLIVDDNTVNIDILVNTLKDEYSLSVAKDGIKAIEIARTKIPDIILLDVMMPEVDGFEVCRILKNEQTTKDIPIIFITAMNDSKNISKAFELGAIDYITKPFQTREVTARISTHLSLNSYKNHLEEIVQVRTTELQDLNLELIKNRFDIIGKLGKAGEYKDHETGKHTIRVSLYCKLVCEKLELNTEITKYIQSCSLMHDLGKIGISEGLINKKGKLTEEEFREVKKHTIIGADILSKKPKALFDELTPTSYIKNPDYNVILQIAANIAAFHHEKWEGTGYPLGLKKEEIPLEARIVAISDVFDALSSKRPYKEAYEIGKCIKIIKDLSGKQFEPKLVDIFTNSINEIKEIMNSNKDS